MSGSITVNLSRPVASVKVWDGDPESVGGEQANSQVDAPTVPSPELEAQKTMFSQASQALNDAAVKLNEFYDKVFADHAESVAKLSVEIARKILMQKVENGDYQIESIIKKAIENAPVRHDVVVHLNPEDYAQSRDVLQNEQDGTFIGIQFVSDPKIERAECLLETPKGIVKSLIAENLERIGQALQRA